MYTHLFVHLTLFNASSFRYFFFFFNDTATTEIYTLSLHDALPIQFALSFGHFHGFSAQAAPTIATRSEEHTSELQSQSKFVCRLLLEKKKNIIHEKKKKKKKMKKKYHKKKYNIK